MNERKLLNGLSYISIVFAPILFPLIVWIASQDLDVKGHAMNALKLHLIPVLLTAIVTVILGFTGLLTNDPQSTGYVGVVLLGIVGLVDVSLAVYNIVKGIKCFIG
ncbi:DUF4870 domain-containing protein [Enterococcus gilvus]|uniref:DUF4870 domain-containing protein n=1 Tax=Enterococcus gilvus TaxID=160453 RepID=UPI00291429C2|nr:DUF4870 domain-containing protein [Enterococcus gilvus]MDU5509096.1 DUF4870 domain-containing protein [Enterococcus gilvus]